MRLHRPRSFSSAMPAHGVVDGGLAYRGFARTLGLDDRAAGLAGALAASPSMRGGVAIEGRCCRRSRSPDQRDQAQVRGRAGVHSRQKRRMAEL